MELHTLIPNRQSAARFVDALLPAAQLEHLLHGGQCQRPAELIRLETAALSALLFALARDHRPLTNLLPILRHGPHAVAEWLQRSAGDDDTRAAITLLRTDPRSARHVHEWAAVMATALANPMLVEIAEGRAATPAPDPIGDLDNAEDP